MGDKIFRDLTSVPLQKQQPYRQSYVTIKRNFNLDNMFKPRHDILKAIFIKYVSFEITVMYPSNHISDKVLQ